MVLMNEIIIQSADEEHLALSQQEGWSFHGTHILEPQFGRSVKDSLVQVTPYLKEYDDNLSDYKDYFYAQDKACFVAISGHTLCGYIVVKENWNHFALVESLWVSPTMRRNRLAFRLMNKVKEWAEQRKLTGLVLESQNNNITACLFYERYGFTLEGIDRCLYKGINQHADEIALFWYYVF